MEIEYTQTNDNLHIVDSWKVSKREFHEVLMTAVNEYDNAHECLPNWYAKRKLRSLYGEWATHNMLYRLGMWKERTKDADLNYPCDKPEWIYIAIGVLAWLLIK